MARNKNSASCFDARAQTPNAAPPDRLSATPDLALTLISYHFVRHALTTRP